MTDTGATLGDLQRSGRARLAAAGVASAALDAALLLCAATGERREALMAYPERTVDDPAADAYRAMIDRRVAREPVSRILGRREFWGLDFAVAAPVLDPRPDTETLVGAALDWLEERPAARIADLGTGSGCILLALLHERPGDGGLGIDISDAALDVARANAAALGLSARASFAIGDWSAELPDGAMDLIVSNPPYIPSGDIDGLEPEVAVFDPVGALDGGADGLAAYRRIAADLKRVLVPGGAAFLEIGAGQENDVAALLERGGASMVQQIPDLSGRIRCLGAFFRAER
ncbi:peptide chain release factor N(5)-glutamine methyltransferase [Emcibacter sp. SYSU 3D8]|uniref:peptide chain release factor N(5)-glutamine methyltransferase n=1 Tax=Emcibacter sp. SYSU 3D8 TaxID=3133969 RepID=UPI0031FF20D7